jgi:twitching motility protein PilT
MAERPAQNVLLGRLAVHYKLITIEQLDAVMAGLGRSVDGKRLGEALVEKGLLRPAQLEQLLEVQRQVLEKQRAEMATKAGRAPAPPEATPRAPEPPRPALRAVPPAAQDAASPAAAPDPPVPATATAAPRATPSATPSAKPSAPPRAASPPAARGGLDEVLRAAVATGASDVHVHAGAPLRLRRHGKLLTEGDAPLDAAATEALVLAALTHEQRESLARHGELDLCYTLEGVGRFRTNVYKQQRGLDGVFRAIPDHPPTLGELGLPSTLAKLTHFHQGMVLVTGPAGCGKSSTMAALVNLVNEERSDHILTIEDPIEYLHPSKRCLVNQRSAKRHTESFARALRAALREDPDVIVIGELRDLETISLALTAAETGHFVLATLHTNDTIRTVNRLVGAFPSDQQGQVRTMLSESLRAVLSQRLVAKADGSGRVPATELLVVNKAVGNLIRENKTFQIRSILQTGAAHGMCLLDQSLQQMVSQGVITKEEAARHMEDAKKLQAA